MATPHSENAAKLVAAAQYKLAGSSWKTTGVIFTALVCRSLVRFSSGKVINVDRALCIEMVIM